MTTAEQCRKSDDPFKTAGLYSVFVSRVSDFRVVFFFGDYSYLAFAVSYAVAETGEGFL